MPLIKAKLCETARNRFAATFAIYIYIHLVYYAGDNSMWRQKIKTYKNDFYYAFNQNEWNESNYEFVIEAIWILWEFKCKFKCIVTVFE